MPTARRKECMGAGLFRLEFYWRVSRLDGYHIHRDRANAVEYPDRDAIAAAVDDPGYVADGAVYTTEDDEIAISFPGLVNGEGGDDSAGFIYDC